MASPEDGRLPPLETTRISSSNAAMAMGIWAYDTDWVLLPECNTVALWRWYCAGTTYLESYLESQGSRCLKDALHVISAIMTSSSDSHARNYSFLGTGSNDGCSHRRSTGLHSQGYTTQIEHTKLRDGRGRVGKLVH